ncbi:hypothetical protein P12x_002562 [Tundrisphaera lichenicola]|uniref:hypothetical protein n=1 Tax=Tundrisphaera lichenicola TaxID=2029860 RepID=UPI003EC0B2AC
MPLRAMFHQTGKSTSLMTHLGARFIRLLSTATKAPKSNPSGSWFSLVQWDLDPAFSIFRCKPNFNASKPAHRDILLGDWWGSETIYQFDHKRVRRKDLVLVAANKDGAGHVDSELPPDYHWLMDGGGWKVNFRPDHGPEREITLHDAHLAVLRQIAHEVLNSRELMALAV